MALLWRKTHKTGGIYVHLPFCVQKCAYCDFYSITDLSLKPTFIKSLIKEIGLRADPSITFDTLYLGGGTPSLFDLSELSAILETVQRHFRLTSELEITIEANPGTLTRERLKAYRQIGIRRINVGIQSFQPALLQFLQRVHNPSQAHNALQDIREAGFRNLGLDLIYGIPNQSLAMWQSDLKQALAFEPEHLSCYMLTIEKGTPLGHGLRAKAFQPLPEAHVAEMYATTMDYLAQEGYEHYEISNFAKLDHDTPGQYRSRHNQKYWLFHPYLGFGPAAHSFDTATRYWNVRQITDYINALTQNRLPVEGCETLTREQQLIEWIFLGLRSKEGISISDLEKHFDLSFMNQFNQPVHRFQESGHLIINEGRCRLTRSGMMIMDSIAAQLIDCI